MIQKLEDTEYTFLEREGDEVILETDDGVKEIFAFREDAPASWCIEFEGGYLEFCSAV